MSDQKYNAVMYHKKTKVVLLAMDVKMEDFTTMAQTGLFVIRKFLPSDNLRRYVIEIETKDGTITEAFPANNKYAALDIAKVKYLNVLQKMTITKSYPLVGSNTE